MTNYRARFYAPTGPLHPWVTRLVDGHTEVFFWRDPSGGDSDTVWIETYVAGQPVAGGAFGTGDIDRLARFLGKPVHS